jgi:hypothetical protein
LHPIGRRNVATRDWTFTLLRRALEELLVRFPTDRINAKPTLLPVNSSWTGTVIQLPRKLSSRGASDALGGPPKEAVARRFLLARCALLSDLCAALPVALQEVP